MSIETISAHGAGGVRLNVHVAGPEDGTPVLLLHGQGCSGRVWQGVMSGRLAHSTRMIAPDYRGHGRSEKPRRGYRSNAIWAADIAALVAHFGLARPTPGTHRSSTILSASSKRSTHFCSRAPTLESTDA